MKTFFVLFASVTLVFGQGLFGDPVLDTIVSGSFGGAGATSAPPEEAWSPTNSVFLRAWFEADDLDASLADGADVATWANKSSEGSSYNLITWPGRNPVFSAEYYNGHDSVRFVSADGMTNHNIYIPQPWTLLVAMRFSDVPSGAQMILTGTNAPQTSLYGGPGYVRLSAGTNLVAGAATTGWTIWMGTAVGGQGVLYSNNTAVASGNVGFNALNGLSVGHSAAASFLNGYVGNILLYGTNLAEADRNALFSYATNLYPVQ